MSDPKSSYGEPVDEPTPTDDVVGRANEGLADAEAARRDAVTESDGSADAPAAPADESAAVEPEPEPAYAASEPTYDAPEPAYDSAPEPDSSGHVATGDTAAGASDSPVAEPAPEPEPDPWESPEAASLSYDPAPTAAPAAEAAPAVTPSEPVADDAPTTADDAPAGAYAAGAAGAGVAATSAAAPAPQPIFVQAPEAPRLRGNRAAAGAIGLLAAVAFAVLYFGAWIGLYAITGEVAGADGGAAADASLLILAQWAFWTPVVVFFFAYWLLGAIINRGRWGAWVVFGLLVGLAAYGGFILGRLFQEPFWMLTPSEGAEVVNSSLFAPLAIAAFIIGRELTIWFGAWTAARGKRVTELNIEAQREYERTLEAGPQLVRQ